MTIDYLSVNLKDCFTWGQAYVACSRGRSLDSMQIVNFDVNKVKTNEEVKKFYKAQKNGTPYTTKWADTIKEFDQKVEDNIKIKAAMKEKYENWSCRKCNKICKMCVVKSNINGNQGKWYIRCPDVYGGGHTFKFVQPNILKQFEVENKNNSSTDTYTSSTTSISIDSHHVGIKIFHTEADETTIENSMLYTSSLIKTPNSIPNEWKKCLPFLLYFELCR